MKHILLFIILIFALPVIAQNPQKAILTFESSSYNFGDITQGTKVEKAFKYTNTGTEPLIISDVVTTCGCTATKWTKEPLLPGQSREILATFDSTGKEGRKNNMITILSNAGNNPSRISIIANVLHAQ